MSGRRQRRILRLTKAAHLPPGKTLETFDKQRLPLRIRRLLSQLCQGEFIDRAENILVFGLPGNPAATAATFELFVKPALKRLTGLTSVLPEKRRAVLTEEVKGGGQREAFLWCRLTWHDNGYRSTVSKRQGSGQIRSVTGKNALLSIPVGVDRLAAGAEVEVFLLDDPAL